MFSSYGKTSFKIPFYTAINSVWERPVQHFDCSTNNHRLFCPRKIFHLLFLEMSFDSFYNQCDSFPAQLLSSEVGVMDIFEDLKSIIFGGAM